MIHARNDYNRIQDPENKIPEDEPVFLIRAQDVVGARTVRAWAFFNREVGGSQSLTESALKQADLMEKWPKHKIADL